MPQTFHLLVSIPNQSPTSFNIEGDVVSLGRSPENDIQILVKEVSTKHCEFHRTDGGYEVTDIGSTNGTKVHDSSAAGTKLALKDRDVMLLGETLPAYFVAVEEGTAIDAASMIAEIEAARSKVAAQAVSAAAAPAAAGPPADAGPTVKKLVPPGAVKKVGLPTLKQPASGPLKPPSIGAPAAAAAAGPATIKLGEVKPQAPLPLSKPGPASQPLTTPPIGAPAAGTPAAPAPATKQPAASPAAKKLPSLAKKTSTPGAAPAAKMATPGAGGPTVKLAVPGGPPAKKLAMPAKKAAAKLNTDPPEE